MDFVVKVSGLDKLHNFLDDVEKNQLPFAASQAINETAKGLRQELASAMDKSFRPLATPYTKSSMFVKFATKRDLRAELSFPGTGRGTPGWKYLSPEVHGGERNLKRSERAFLLHDVLPPGMLTVPGKAARLDPYGDMSKGQIVQLMSYFRVFNERGYKANISEKKRARMAKGTKRAAPTTYFVSRGRSLEGRAQHLPPGIYQKVAFAQGTAVRPLVRFIPAARYSKRFPMNDIANRYADRVFLHNLSQAVEKALLTAK
jgi:hypothetical protein